MANPSARDILILIFSAEKIAADEAQANPIIIENFVSKPVNPALLLESIGHIFERRADVQKGAEAAKRCGSSPGYQ